MLGLTKPDPDEIRWKRPIEIPATYTLPAVKRMSLFTTVLLGLIASGLHLAGVPLDTDAFAVIAFSCAGLLGLVAALPLLTRLDPTEYRLDAHRLWWRSGQHPHEVELADIARVEQDGDVLRVSWYVQPHSMERIAFEWIAGAELKPDSRQTTIAPPEDENLREEVLRRLTSGCPAEVAPMSEPASSIMIRSWSGLVVLLLFGVVWGTLVVSPLWCGFEHIGIAWRTWCWICLGGTLLLGPGTWLSFWRFGRRGLVHAAVRRELLAFNLLVVCMSTAGAIAGGFALVAALGLPA